MVVFDVWPSITSKKENNISRYYFPSHPFITLRISIARGLFILAYVFSLIFVKFKSRGNKTALSIDRKEFCTLAYFLILKKFFFIFKISWKAKRKPVNRGLDRKLAVLFLQSWMSSWLISYQSINQSAINQSINQSINQLINQSKNEWINHIMNNQ